MHGEYYEGYMLPSDIGNGPKPRKSHKPVANKDAMASMTTLVGDDDGVLKKLDSSEKPSATKSSNFLKQLMKKGQSKDAPEHTSSHKGPKTHSQAPLREPRMPSWESMAVYASLK